MEPAVYENYPLQIQGLLFIGLLVGVVAAEMLCSGRLSDRIMAILAKRNDNQRVPEMRLWLGYPAAVISAVGVLLWGLSVDNHWHWMVGQVAFFLCESFNYEFVVHYTDHYYKRCIWAANWQYCGFIIPRRQLSRTRE